MKKVILTALAATCIVTSGGSDVPRHNETHRNTTRHGDFEALSFARLIKRPAGFLAGMIFNAPLVGKVPANPPRGG